MVSECRLEVLCYRVLEVLKSLQNKKKGMITLYNQAQSAKPSACHKTQVNR